MNKRSLYPQRTARLSREGQIIMVIMIIIMIIIINVLMPIPTLA